MEERLILVDEKDNIIGSEFKLATHKQGLLHRAFSVFIFDQTQRLLLQQRAATKYHSPNLWSNTCCGHPRKGEETQSAASRRLNEEMGFYTPIIHVSSFTYREEVPGNLIEHEFDHIYIGQFNQIPQVNPNEAGDWRWIDLGELRTEIEAKPEQFTVWFKRIINDVGYDELKRWSGLVLE